MNQDLDTRFRAAVQSYWSSRSSQMAKQQQTGQVDAGLRGAVTGGAQMNALEELVIDVLCQAGLCRTDIKSRRALELPGYYRPEKKWDLLVVSGGQLVAAIEFKSQVGPSFGNNYNNRTEEALGSATDIWTAYREGRFGHGPRPFLGYFFLLEDCPQVRKPVKNSEPYFKVDPAFAGASYSKRYEIFCQRMVLERVYDAACLTLATNSDPTEISHPTSDLAFQRFIATLAGHVYTFLRS